jgi:hypothetical protein
MHVLLALVLAGAPQMTFTDPELSLTVPFDGPFQKSAPESQALEGVTAQVYSVQSVREPMRELLSVQRFIGTQEKLSEVPCRERAQRLAYAVSKASFACNDEPVSDGAIQLAPGLWSATLTGDRCVDELGHTAVRVRALCDERTPGKITLLAWGTAQMTDDDPIAQMFICGPSLGGVRTCGAPCDVAGALKSHVSPDTLAQEITARCELWPATLRNVMDSLKDVGPTQRASIAATALDDIGGSFANAACAEYGEHFKAARAAAESVSEEKADEMLARTLFTQCGSTMRSVFSAAELSKLSKDANARGYALLAPAMYQRLVDRGVDKATARKFARVISRLER